MNWNMPYGLIASSGPRAVDHASPLSDVVVTTPTSQHEAPSPMTVAVREMTAIERARLFLQGRQMDLLKSLDTPQRMLVTSTSLSAPLLIACIVPCRHGCISIGFSPSKPPNIGVGAPRIGLLAFLASMTTLNEQWSQYHHRLLRRRMQVHQCPIQLREWKR